jgi:NitT/TauT family transport system substrate-binding protein
MVRTRKFGAVAAGLSLSVLVAACGNEAAAQESSDGLQQIEIAVTQWPSLVFSVPYHVAIEKGFFEDEGIEVTGVVATQGGGTTIRSILGGHLAFGEAASAAVADSFDAGAPLVAVGGGVQAVGDVVWVTSKDSELNSIEDLPGHSVGFTNPGGVTQSVLAMSVDRAGLDPSSVDMRATGGVSEGLTALEGGGVDATIHAEPVYSMNPDDYKLLWRSTDLISEYQQTLIVTSPQLAESDPDLVRGFLAARARAVEFMQQNPEEAAQIWAERGDIDPEAAKSALTALLKVDEWGVGFSAEGLAAAEEGMHAAGLLTEDERVPWKDFVNQEFLPEDVKPVDLP